MTEHNLGLVDYDSPRIRASSINNKFKKT